jgi:glycosyltransferase involved in cell wall biosynthesis
MMFSIVIPTFNRPEKIRTCLNSIAKIKYPVSQFEVIVIDDGSSMPVRQVIAKDQFPFALKILRQENNGPGLARNYGVSEAQGRWIAFTDDDCEPTPNWLMALQATLERNPGALVGGLTLNQCRENICAITNELLLTTVCEWLSRFAPDLNFFTSNNLACERIRFGDVGGFHANLVLAAGEDREFCMRWSAAGGLLIRQSEAVVHHGHSQNLLQFTEMHFRYGRGARMIRDNSPAPRVLGSRLDLYKQMLMAPIRQMPWTQAIRSIPLLAWSQWVSLLGFAYQHYVTKPSSNKLSS